MAMGRTDDVRSQRSGRRTVVLVCRAWPAAGSRVVAEGTAPEEASLLPTHEAADPGTSAPLPSLGPGVAAPTSAAPSAIAVSLSGTRGRQ